MAGEAPPKRSKSLAGDSLRRSSVFGAPGQGGASPMAGTDRRRSTIFGIASHVLQGLQQQRRSTIGQRNPATDLLHSIMRQDTNLDHSSEESDTSSTSSSEAEEEQSRVQSRQPSVADLSRPLGLGSPRHSISSHRHSISGVARVATVASKWMQKTAASSASAAASPGGSPRSYRQRLSQLGLSPAALSAALSGVSQDDDACSGQPNNSTFSSLKEEEEEKAQQVLQPAPADREAKLSTSKTQFQKAGRMMISLRKISSAGHESGVSELSSELRQTTAGTTASDRILHSSEGHTPRSRAASGLSESNEHTPRSSYHLHPEMYSPPHSGHSSHVSHNHAHHHHHPHHRDGERGSHGHAAPRAASKPPPQPHVMTREQSAVIAALREVANYTPDTVEEDGSSSSSSSSVSASDGASDTAAPAATIQRSQARHATTPARLASLESKEALGSGAFQRSQTLTAGRSAVQKDEGQGRGVDPSQTESKVDAALLQPPSASGSRHSSKHHHRPRHHHHHHRHHQRSSAKNYAVQMQHTFTKHAEFAAMMTKKDRQMLSVHHAHAIQLTIDETADEANRCHQRWVRRKPDHHTHMMTSTPSEKDSQRRKEKDEQVEAETRRWAMKLRHERRNDICHRLCETWEDKMPESCQHVHFRRKHRHMRHEELSMESHMASSFHKVRLSALLEEPSTSGAAEPTTAAPVLQEDKPPMEQDEQNGPSSERPRERRLRRKVTWKAAAEVAAVVPVPSSKEAPLGPPKRRRLPEVPRLRSRFRDESRIMSGMWNMHVNTVKRYHHSVAEMLGLGGDDWDAERVYEVDVSKLEALAEKKEFARQVAAASRIQRHWRNSIFLKYVRRHLESCRKPASRIQRWWRHRVIPALRRRAARLRQLRRAMVCVQVALTGKQRQGHFCRGASLSNVMKGLADLDKRLLKQIGMENLDKVLRIQARWRGHYARRLIKEVVGSLGSKATEEVEQADVVESPDNTAAATAQESVALVDAPVIRSSVRLSVKPMDDPPVVRRSVSVKVPEVQSARTTRLGSRQSGSFRRHLPLKPFA